MNTKKVTSWATVTVSIGDVREQVERCWDSLNSRRDNTGVQQYQSIRYVNGELQVSTWPDGCGYSQLPTPVQLYDVVVSPDGVVSPYGSLPVVLLPSEWGYPRPIWTWGTDYPSRERAIITARTLSTTLGILFVESRVIRDEYGEIVRFFIFA